MSLTLPLGSVIPSSLWEWIDSDLHAYQSFQFCARTEHQDPAPGCRLSDVPGWLQAFPRYVQAGRTTAWLAQRSCARYPKNSSHLTWSFGRPGLFVHS